MGSEFLEWQENICKSSPFYIWDERNKLLIYVAHVCRGGARISFGGREYEVSDNYELL
jgi:hypothetical protein